LRPFPLGLLAAWLAGAAALADPAAAVHFPQGEKIEFTGVVSDRQGTPLEGVQVVLEVSRNTFSLRRLRRVEEETRRLQAVTTAGGAYTISWPWDSFFNHFELAVGIPVRKPGGERFAPLARLDVTDRLRGGTPVVSALVVENRKLLDSLRTFLASLKTVDERHVYEEMGKPDEVKRTQYSDTSYEASWWYFELGKMYRFQDGRLAQVVPFDPVKRFSTSP